MDIDAFAQGQATERRRVEAIVCSDEARGQESFAAKLACKTTLSPELALEFLRQTAHSTQKPPLRQMQRAAEDLRGETLAAEQAAAEAQAGRAASRPKVVRLRPTAEVVREYLAQRDSTRKAIARAAQAFRQPMLDAARAAERLSNSASPTLHDLITK